MFADDQRFELLLQRVEPGSILLRTWPVQGGVSAEVSGLEIRRADGQVQRLIARRHGAVDRARNPNIAADEFALLQRLHAAGLAVPTARYLDQSGEIFATPVLLLDYVDGTAGFVPEAKSLQQFAQHLAGVHALDYARLDLAFLPRQEEHVAGQLRAQLAADGSPEEQRILEVLRAAWPLAQRNRSCLLHGDYWPGNTLWNGGQLAAVIDWEDAAIGDPLADVANARLELRWAGDVAAMELFSQHYQSFAALDTANLPYWELYAALRPARNIASWGLDAQAEQAMREGLRMFIRQAIARLPER